ncbi:nSTAND3 domain-containing NTPase [Amycolatopsis pigmentata]|uniref:Restriction endonuclease n=1 Tax=Amycolatopsis pigmentata TaxID=450801 RepID=A0ABW5FK70_9PSEU
MDEFDLGRLTDFDFEELCKDLFEVVLDCPLEVFARGRDGGIDLRYISPASEDTTIIQCKHWMRSGRNALIRHLRKEELAKVERLGPDRYLLATTVQLTVGAKDEIAAIFSGCLRSPGDVYGAQEIVALLRRNPEVVRRHIRLWLASSAILSSLINRDVLHRSRVLALDIDESLRRFVPHEGSDHARRLLNNQHSCLIVGPPGVGKTTLAHVLLADYQAKGFTMIEATNHLEDVHRMWNDDEKQIFFVDDFVGQTTLDETAARLANQELPRLLRMIRKSSTKRLVLTCRNYLIIQAREHHERLDEPALSPYECSIDAAGFASTIRAEIFYNHIYFSDLAPRERAQLARPDVYRYIISHRNYSPRLLEHALAEVTTLPPEEYGNIAHIVIRNLENPAHLWERLIEEVLDADELALVLVLYTANRSASHDRLRDAWRAHLSIVANSDTDRRFRRSLRRLEPLIVRVNDDVDERRVAFSNPSIVDFLHNHLARNSEIVGTLFDSALFLDQLVTIWTSSSAWWVRDTLRDAVTSHMDRLRDAVVRVGDLDALLGEYRTTDHEATVAEFIIALGEFDQSPELAAAGIDVLDEVIEAYRPSVGTLYQLTVDVAKSSIPAWRRYAQELANITYSAAIDGIREWEDAQRLEAILNDLAELSPRVAELGEEELNVKKLAMGIEELEKWTDDNYEPDIDQDTLEAILEFLDFEAHGLDDEYDRARNYFDRTSKPEDAPPVEVSRTFAHNPSRIEAMFSTFRRD